MRFTQCAGNFRANLGTQGLGAHTHARMHPPTLPPSLLGSAPPQSPLSPANPLQNEFMKQNSPTNGWFNPVHPSPEYKVVSGQVQRVEMLRPAKNEAEHGRHTKQAYEAVV